MKKLCNILLLLLFIACVDESQRNISIVETSLFMEVKVSDSDKNISRTRVTAYPDNDINDIDVVIFKRSGTTELFYERYSIPASAIEDIDSYDGLHKGFYLDIEPELLSINVGARIMVLANCREILDANMGLINENTSRMDFHDFMQYIYEWQGEGVFPFDNIPMCGIHSILLVADGDNRLPDKIEIPLMRMFARIDVGIDMNNSSSALRDKFEIKRVGVFGTMSNPCIMRNYDEPLYEYEATIPNITSIAIRIVDMRHWYKYEINDQSSYSMKKIIYVPESEKLNQSDTYKFNLIDTQGGSQILNGVNPQDKPYNGTFLILEASYNNAPLSYYRVDFHSGYDYMPVLRNGKYEINITNVAKDGEPTLEGAMAKPYKTTRALRQNLSSEFEYDIHMK